MMIFTNALQKAPAVTRDTALAFVRVLAPFAPHISEELWERLGERPSVLGAPWPAFDTGKLASQEVKLVFQVNGKHRGDQLVRIGLPQEEAIAVARANPRIIPYLQDKNVKRIVYVPNKILNIVVD